MIMPFGKFRGHEIGALPDDYLEWLGNRDLYGDLADAVSAALAARQQRKRKTANGTHALVQVQLPDLQLVQEVIERGYKAARIHHPDHGGDLDTMRRLNAVADALREQLERLAS